MSEEVTPAIDGRRSGVYSVMAPAKMGAAR
jgi:hypothetical protein